MSSTTPVSSFDLTPTPAGERTSTSSLSRVLGLARANAVLMARNRMTLGYAVFMPLFPILFLLAGERGDVSSGIAALGSVLMLASLFPVFYNLLSMVTTRRDELVLKRLRTGESRDGEILVSMALPGVVIFVAVAALATIAAAALGQPLSLDPLVMIVTVALVAAVFAGLAFWTAAWTRNAEAAQITSMPVVVLGVLGNLRPLFPDNLHPIVDLTPGSALDALVRIGWFGQDRDGDALSYVDGLAAAAQPAAVLVAWTAVAIFLAVRTMRWEPRA